MSETISKIKPPLWQCAALDRERGERCTRSGSVKLPGRVAWICQECFSAGNPLAVSGTDSKSETQQELPLGGDTVTYARDVLKSALDAAQDAKQWRLSAEARRDQLRAALEAVSRDWEMKVDRERAADAAAEKAQAAFDDAKVRAGGKK